MRQEKEQRDFGSEYMSKSKLRTSFVWIAEDGTGRKRLIS